MDEKDRIIAALKKEIEELKEIIKELLNRNSGNSSQCATNAALLI